jgi:hypothetical protein
MRKHTNRLLLCTLIFAATSFAGKSTISPTDFVPKDVEVGTSIPMIPDLGNKLLASPLSAMEPGYLYLRKKNDARTYSWYKAKPTPDAFRILKAFRPDGMSPDSFAMMKFYPTRIAKAYQDEAEIYFDRNFIYSSRVPTLFFVSNDLWIELKSQEISMGSLEVESTPPATAILDQDSAVATPLTRAGLVTGIHVVKLSAPGFLPVASGVNVAKGQTTRKNIQLIPVDTTGFSASVPVSMDALLGATVLPDLEPLWDVLQVSKDKYASFLEDRKQHFGKLYPKLMPAPVGTPVGDVNYARYRDAYQQTRDEAYGIFLSSQVSGSKELEEMISLASARKDSLELLTITERVLVENIKATPEALGVVGIQLKFKSKDGRLDAGWLGSFKDSTLVLDSILPTLKDSLGWWYFSVTLQNKPVKLISANQPFRKQYRYASLALVGPNGSIPLIGKFVLPDYLMEQPVVLAWLGVPVKVDTTKNIPEAFVPTKVTDERPIWLAQLRGEIAEIPGGTFRYKGKMVEMSPFALNTKEVSQEHFQWITLQSPASKNKAKYVGARKPVHNIDWEEAEAFCREIGGALPTEAQWEYAARAGTGEVKVPGAFGDFAVYYENSAKLKMEDPAHGPQPVGLRKANAWGLYDIAGNVSEWTNDYDSWFSFFVDSKDPKGAFWGTDRIFKGGNWKSDSDELNLSERDYEDPRYWGSSMGVRCAFPSMQVRSLDSLKVILTQKDSLATAKGVVLMGGALKTRLAK